MKEKIERKERELIDNWQHRNKKMICDTCMWFLLKNTITEEFAIKGRCIKHAPTLNGFPVVFHTDRCGDHKLN